ncbi:hypothetical protein AgCh_018229 [Apium graveolens]
MAPKRQRTQVSSNTTDSSNVGGVRPMFSTPEAKAEYTRLLSKPISKERRFLPSGRGGMGILRFLRGSTTGSIPYASIVTKLCVAVRVHWSAHKQLQLPSASIDSSTIVVMREWNQAKLQRNLMYLAAIADSQPQPPTMHSQGKLTDGTVFDSILERGDPIEFELGTGQLIKG